MKDEIGSVQARIKINGNDSKEVGDNKQLLLVENCNVGENWRKINLLVIKRKEAGNIKKESKGDTKKSHGKS